MNKNLTKPFDEHWLNSATRGQKESLLRSLLTQKSLKDRDKLKNFQPNPSLIEGEMGGQERFLRSQAKIRLVTTANQWGKTHVGAYEACAIARGVHPYKNVVVPNTGVIVTAKSFDDGIENEIVPKIKEVCGAADIVKFGKNAQGIHSTVHFKGGSVAHLMSAEQKNVAFESKKFHWIWIDEPVRREIWIALFRGMLTTDGLAWITATLLDEPWIWEEIYEPGMAGVDSDIEIFTGPMEENRRVTDKARKAYIARLTPDEIKTRVHGIPMALAGRTIKCYEAQYDTGQPHHLIPSFNIPPHWPVWLSIDPHADKPHAVLFIAASPQGPLYACNEIFVQCTLHELADFINDVRCQYNMVDQIADSSIQNKDWGKRSGRDLLEDKGIRVKLARKKDKKQGIFLVNQKFKDDEFFVMQHCVRTHRELTLNRWKKNQRDPQIMLGEAEKKMDDMIDNVRYIFEENPEYTGSSPIHEIGPIGQRI